MILTDSQILAREVDAALAAVPAPLFPLLVPAARLALAGEWSGEARDGRPCCRDCGRAQAYGNHPCSCPYARIRRKLGARIAEAEADEALLAEAEAEQTLDYFDRYIAGDR